MLYSGVTGLDMVLEALFFPDIPLPRFVTLVMCNCLVNVVWITLSEVMPARNWLTRLITCYPFSNVLNTPGCWREEDSSIGHSIMMTSNSCIAKRKYMYSVRNSTSTKKKA